MADRNVNPGVETIPGRAASTYDLVTLEEAKLLMGLPLADLASDEQISLFISINSAVVSERCHRIFGREMVIESWRDVGCRRIFLSHWPVLPEDIQSVEAPRGTFLDPADWELESSSGKLSIFSGDHWQEPVVVTYTGGYNLPEEAPLPLKRAVGMLNLQSNMLARLGTMAGIRQLTHKDSRVMFHDPTKLLQAFLGSGGGQGAVESALSSLLANYTRYEV